MRNENVDLMLEIYGKEFEKLKWNRPYIDIIKKGFQIILDGEGIEIFETVIESEIIWFIKSCNFVDRQMILELNVFKKFWIILERKGRSCLIF